jgi:hypothetical protein
MGFFSDVANVLTGGASGLVESVGGHKLSSLLSGGLTDVAKGNAPFTSITDPAIEKLGLDEATTNWLKDVQSQTMTAGFDQPAKAYERYKDTGDFWAGLDRFIDPAGTIDYSLRSTGDLIYDVAPEVVPYIQPVAATIGSLWGPGYAAAGSGIGSKLASGTRSYDYGEDFKDAAIAAVAAYIAGEALGAGGEAAQAGTEGATQAGTQAATQAAEQTALETIGQGALKGAMSGAARGIVPALQEGSFTPIVEGGITGAVTGGATSGIGELINTYLGTNMSPEELKAYEVAEKNPGAKIYVDNVPSTGPQPTYAPADTSPVLLDEAGNIQYDTNGPESMYPITEGGQPNYDPADVSKMYEPSTVEPTTIEKIGKGILDNAGTLKSLASIFGAAGAPGFTFEDIGGGGGGGATPESDWFSNIAASGTGKGKSKGITASDVKSLYHGRSFMPNLNEIEKEQKQDQYYS